MIAIDRELRIFVRGIVLLLVAGFAAAWYPHPVHAWIGGIWKPVADRAGDDKNVYNSKIVVDSKLTTGTVTRLQADPTNSLLLVVLRDGSTRLWDLERGFQVGGAIGHKVLSGAVRRRPGRVWEIVSVHTDGSWRVWRPRSPRELRDARAPNGDHIVGFDSSAQPALSSDGSTMAYRTTWGRWRVLELKEDGRKFALPDAHTAALPILSRDGSTIVYRSTAGAMVAVRISDRGVQRISGSMRCRKHVTVTAGAFLAEDPDRQRIVLGDARKYICAWEIARESGLRQLFRERDGDLSDAVRLLAAGRDGDNVAVADGKGKLNIWSMYRKERLSSLEWKTGLLRPLLVLDSKRGWILSGEQDGTVVVRSLKDLKDPKIARLISTRLGWAVLDRMGRFHGSDRGIEALNWEGQQGKQKQFLLPVDNFSPSYYEPNLLAKLDDENPIYLTEPDDDLFREYPKPPTVKIRPIKPGRREPGTVVRFEIEVEKDYKSDGFVGVRLSNNGKLVPETQMVRRTDSNQTGIVVIRHASLVPGRNVFRAIGIGKNNIESTPAEVVIEADQPAPSKTDLKIVSIGINDYGVPAWKLNFAAKDVQTLSKKLTERSGSLFGEVQSYIRINKQATLDSIKKLIDPGESSPQDVLVVHFSGHGYGRKDENGNSEWYLIPYSNKWPELRESRTKFNEAIPEHGLSSRVLMNMLSETKAQRVFLILDACYSGAALKGLSQSDTQKLGDARAQKALRELGRVGGFDILAASQANEIALEVPEIGHGALTYLVIKGIEGEAEGATGKSNDGKISVREVMTYATQQMAILPELDNIRHKPAVYMLGEDFPLADRSKETAEN